MTHAEHTVTVEASLAEVWAVLVDVERYADIFPPTQDVTIVEEGDGYQVIKLTVEVNGEVHTWKSRRDVDEERHVIAYRQVETAPLVDRMAGEWRAFSLGPVTTQLVLTHDYAVREPVDGKVAGRFTPEEAETVLHNAVERNSVADLGAVRQEAERRQATVPGR
ncbi:aromatase/cyclase [Amycolatopsis cihanbeyliensis]|uniref:Ribosome-associated toxin RatA of RatAB toxin-antitoxin module n=1 Tax=Amycolatopsis cihanbeyliensis TaxID=1128664 RepID=A0A542DBR7_AMYCI|nr:aromatase/cyclase [Amycolatopsis cihanbeyliensis]TQJ00521.1 ribosome-associated toxin RatA of RatAB toxin-antitoxin module [Amycolatopsis cihanbeyliensis]